MTGWICQSRKLLSTVMASLADDVQQTVQDFNDAIHRLSSTHEDTPSTHRLSSTHEDTPSTLSQKVSDNISEPKTSHSGQNVPDDQHQVSPTVEEPRPQNQDQVFVARKQFTATLTTQPETSGFPSTLNSRLSQSSPTLPISENIASDPGDGCLNTRPLTAKSAVRSMVSASSPCLVHTQATSAEASVRASLDISEHDLRRRPQTSKHTMASVSENVSPCHRHDFLKITHGMKHPGKVIRTQSSITQEQAQSPIREDSSQSPIIEGYNCSFNQTVCTQVPGMKSHDDIHSPRTVSHLKDLEPGSHHDREQLSTSPRTVSDLTDQELGSQHDREQLSTSPRTVSDLTDQELGSQQAREQLSTLVLVDHDIHFLRWASLRPLTRMLSFAFAQLANVAVIFSENFQSVHSLTPSDGTPGIESQHHELTSDMHLVDIVDPRQIETTSKYDFSEQEVQYLNVPRRTYSTDSFEIIESCCYNGTAEGNKFCEGMISEYQNNQLHTQPSSDALNETLEFSVCHFSSEHPDHASGCLTDMPTSSIELVNFDFRKLLTDRQFEITSMFQGSSQRAQRVSSRRTDSGNVVVRDSSLVTPVNDVSSRSIDSGYVVVRDSSLVTPVNDVSSRSIDSGYIVVRDSSLVTPVNDDSSNSDQRDCRDRDEENHDIDEDDDGDSSASFIILSENDVNNTDCIC